MVCIKPRFLRPEVEACALVLALTGRFLPEFDVWFACQLVATSAVLGMLIPESKHSATAKALNGRRGRSSRVTPGEDAAAQERALERPIAVHAAAAEAGRFADRV
jgi:hypothetical protein